MELRHLRYFVAVAEELNFRRAAARLNISQPPLSLQVQQLERELGSRLLDRGQQRVALTVSGRVFLDHARAILAAVAAASSAVIAAETGEGGELTIGFTPSAEFQPFLSSTIKGFRERYPGIGLKLREMTSSEQLEAVECRELDIGISRWPAQRPSTRVSMSEIFRDSLVAVVCDTSPMADRGEIGIADLRESQFVSLPHDTGTGLRTLTLNLCLDNGFVPDIVQEARELPTVIALVGAGMGVAIVPASLRCVAAYGVVYLKIRDEGAHPALYLLQNTTSESIARARFVERLRQSVMDLIE